MWLMLSVDVHRLIREKLLSERKGWGEGRAAEVQGQGFGALQ